MALKFQLAQVRIVLMATLISASYKLGLEGEQGRSWIFQQEDHQTLMITSAVKQKGLLMLLKAPFAISSLFFSPHIFPFLPTPVLLGSTGGNTRLLMNYSDTLLHDEYPLKIPTGLYSFSTYFASQLVVSATTENISRQHWL